MTAPKEVGRWTIEIIKRRDAGKGFEVVPRRRGADRSFARRSLWETLTKETARRPSQVPSHGPSRPLGTQCEIIAVGREASATGPRPSRSLT